MKLLICMLVWVDEKLKLVIYSWSIIAMLNDKAIAGYHVKTQILNFTLGLYVYLIFEPGKLFWFRSYWLSTHKLSRPKAKRYIGSFACLFARPFVGLESASNRYSEAKPAIVHCIAIFPEVKSYNLINF